MTTQTNTRTSLALGALLACALANAQGFFQTQRVVDSQPGFTTGHTATARFNQAVQAIEFGVRVSPSAALQDLRMSASSGTPVSGNISQWLFRAQNVAALSRIGMRASVRPRADFRGAVQITFFVRNPGASTDLFTDQYFMSVGALPAPVLEAPLANAILSAAPTFRFQLPGTTVAQPVTPQIEITGPSSRLLNLPTQSTGSTVTYFVPLDGGLQPGSYTYRLRALDQRGKPGEWTTPRTFVASGGIDMAGFGSQSFFNTLRAAGWYSFYQAAWGGRNIWPDARQNLVRAHNAGFKVAAYVFLNFDNGSTIAGAPANQTGDWQVDRALAGIGFNGNKASLPYDLKYVMVDVENRFWGTMSQADRVQRIAEAVQRVRNLGFWPMVYTRNEGVNQWWNDATGSSRDFREMPLWDSKPETLTAVYKDHLDLNLGVPWIRYGGWRERAGKQYLLDLNVAGGRVDFNVWHPDVWNVTSPPPGDINVFPANLTLVRNSDNTIKATVTVGNSGSVEAYAVRLGNAQLGNASLVTRLSIGHVPVGGSRNGSYIFPASAGVPGTVASMSFVVWTGKGPQTHNVWTVLP